MTQGQISFDDGAAYEHMMGKWSRLAGQDFLDWLAPAVGQRWIDVGCGNGAFTDLIVERCAPSSAIGIDPSEGQLAYARSRNIPDTRFEAGDAMMLPFADACFDTAVMALVLFFVPEPAQGVAEMQRVVKPGGQISAYVWDVLEPGGFPLAPMQEELRSLSITPMLPPRADISHIDALGALWADAGLENVHSRQLTVTRTFRDFSDYWSTIEIALTMGQSTRGLSKTVVDALKHRLLGRLPAATDGSISCTARANAVTGDVPA